MHTFDDHSFAPSPLDAGSARGARAGYRLARSEPGNALQLFLKSFDPKAAVWLAMGFCAGMVSWHAIGFWGFVSNTVLNHGEPTTTSATALRPLALAVMNTSATATGALSSFSPLPEACVDLVVDRATQLTSAERCSAGGQPMRDAGRRRRGDRLTEIEARQRTINDWPAATVAQEIPVAGGAVSASDFDLTLTMAR